MFDDVDPRSIACQPNRDLWAALHDGDVEAVHEALSEGAHPDADPDEWVMGQLCPLSYAIRHGGTKCALVLIEAGASASHFSSSQIPWVDCVVWNRVEVFEALVEAGRPFLFGDVRFALKAALGPYMSQHALEGAARTELEERGRLVTTSSPSVSVVMTHPSPEWVRRIVSYGEGSRAWTANDMSSAFASMVRFAVIQDEQGDIFEAWGSRLARCLEMLEVCGVMGPDHETVTGGVYWGEMARGFSNDCLLNHPDVVEVVSRLVSMDTLRSQCFEATPAYREASLAYDSWVSALENAVLEHQVPSSALASRKMGRL